MSKKDPVLVKGKVVFSCAVNMLGTTVTVKIVKAKRDDTARTRTRYDRLGVYEGSERTAWVSDGPDPFLRALIRHELTHAALDLSGNDAYAQGANDYHANLYSEEKIAALNEHVLPSVTYAADIVMHERAKAMDAAARALPGALAPTSPQATGASRDG